ncbi:LOW QUALITY PROTEIN: gap junction protein beta 9b [Cyprinus carpio]|uniref:LOW QUALITY PROTEIN: gap junction protein beta 9b n=1 Tax=Cyprinus carpio TaxID=7962 RepID=A0A9R0AJW9_CYPCA|nr:LOW QUALITY PROTEIN: gap junction protein beta 9b [Cyprinus carpio]
MNWLSLQVLLGGTIKFSTLILLFLLSVQYVFSNQLLMDSCTNVCNDKQKDFICNTAQPGCTNVCYDNFFPISHIRLWALQIIFVTCPSLMVVAHVKYREMKDQKYTNVHKGEHMYANPGKKRGGLWYTYILSLVFKAGFDAGFLYILYIIYQFDMPNVTKCSVEPCPNTVDCYISRPTEKKIFTLFMVVTSSVCIFMCICEIFYLITKKVRKCLLRKQEQNTVTKPNYIRVDPTASSNQNLSNFEKAKVAAGQRDSA